MSGFSKFRLWLRTTKGTLWYFGIGYSLTALLMVYLLCWPAHAAVRPASEMPRLSPEKALESDKAKPLCLEGTTRYRVLMFPDGRKQYVGLFTIWERCK